MKIVSESVFSTLNQNSKIVDLSEISNFKLFKNLLILRGGKQIDCLATDMFFESLQFNWPLNSGLQRDSLY